MFRPICITAWLRCGVISDPYLPLDGILLYEACRRQFNGQPEASIPGQGSLAALSREMMAPTLPLLMVYDGDYRYYACSFAEWGRPFAEGRDYWNKREDSGKHTDLLDVAVSRIETSKGRYKAYHMPVFYRVAPWVRWWAVGDAAAIKDLLATIAAIGKKRVYGWGRVLRWEVQEMSEDKSVIVAGVPQRSVPVTSETQRLVAPGIRQVFWGYYPPYYESANQAMCYMPPSNGGEERQGNC